MKTVDWSPDGLQLASGDDKGVIQVLRDVELFLLMRTFISVLSLCGFSLRFFDSFGAVHGMFMMNA